MSDEYRVGYRRPPLDTRFKKGKSGNPKGRAKGSKNTQSLLEEELSRPITVREGGVEKRMPVRRALLRQQINKALQGDSKAARLIIDKDAEIETKTPTVAPEALEIKDKAILDAFRHRARPKARRRKGKKAG